MTLDRSLKGKGRLARARSVLTRNERIAKMREEDRWIDGQSPFGLPKIRVVKTSIGKKKKVKKEADADAEAAADDAKSETAEK